jgi:hypothetical protein
MRVLIAALLLMMDSPAVAYSVPDIEPVYGVSVTKDAVTVHMGHAACTKKSDLTVAVGKTPPRPLILFARKHPVACADGGQVEIVYSLEELGLQPGQAFSLANPLVGAAIP